MTDFQKKLVSRIPGFIRRNFLRKVSAAFFAFVIVATVRSSQDQTVSARLNNVRVRFELSQDVLFQTSVPPEISVSIDVTAKRSLLERLNPDDFELVKRITPDDVKRNSVSFDLQDVVFKRPRMQDRVTVRNILPGNQPLELDQIVRVEKMVKLNLDVSELPSGYVFKQAQTPADQKKVVVQGPSRIVSKIKEITTEKVPLVNATQNFTTTVKLIRQDDELVFSFDKVLVDVEISERIHREFAGVPVQILLTPPNDPDMEYTVDPATVTVSLDKSSIGLTEWDIVKSELHPYVNVTDREERIQCEVLCWSDRKDINIISVTPKKVTLTARKRTPPPAGPEQKGGASKK